MPQPRKPTAQLLREGSFLAHPERLKARLNEPKPTKPLGKPPSWLSLNERDCWNELKKLIPPGVAAASDRWAFEVVVVLMVRFRTGEIKVGEINALRSLLSLFGMTPADRSRVTAAPAEKDNDPFAEFVAASA